MAAKIGILGDTTVTTGDSITTLYTVGTDKAARVRVLFACEGGSGSWSYNVYIGTPGSEVTIGRSMTSGQDLISGINGSGSKAANLIGIVEIASGLNINSNGDRDILPFPHDYYLNEGDTVRVQIGSTTANDHVCQVMGVEDDV